MNQKDVNDRFTALLEKDSWWSKFVGSQFVSMLSLFVGQMVYRCEQFAARALQEGFISIATRRASILAAAEDRGYVGRRISPSTGLASVTNNTTARLQLPIYSTFQSEELEQYMLMDAVDLEAGETKELAASQLEIFVVEKTVEAEEPFLTVILSRDMTAVCHSIDVYVIVDTLRVKWEKSFQFRSANNTSLVYTEFYKPSEQMGIRFGDGSTGVMPPAGSVISLDVWCTNGQTTLVQGQKLIPTDDFAELENDITVITTSPISGGTPAESTEETRARAQYFVSYDEQVVWGDDYTFYLKNHIGGISWLRCWGEMDQEKFTGYDLANINSIFLCGHKPGLTQEELHAAFTEKLESIPNKMNKRFRLIDANFRPFTITLTGNVPSTSVPNEVEITLKNELGTRFGRDSQLFETGGGFKAITEDQIWAFIDALGYFTNYVVDIVLVDNVDPLIAVNLEDFIYLDPQLSTFNITFQKS